MPQKKKAADTAVQQATASGTKISLALAVALLIFSGGLALISLPYSKNFEDSKENKYSESCETLAKLCTQKDYKNQKEACTLFSEECVADTEKADTEKIEAKITGQQQGTKIINNQNTGVITNPIYWDLGNSSTAQNATPTPAFNNQTIGNNQNTSGNTTTNSNICDSTMHFNPVVSSTTSTPALYDMWITDLDSVYSYKIGDANGNLVTNDKPNCSYSYGAIIKRRTDISGLQFPLKVSVTDCSWPTRNECIITAQRP